MGKSKFSAFSFQLSVKARSTLGLLLRAHRCFGAHGAPYKFNSLADVTYEQPYPAEAVTKKANNMWLRRRVRRAHRYVGAHGAPYAYVTYELSVVSKSTFTAQSFALCCTLTTDN
jgi:hypothetical protein